MPVLYPADITEVIRASNRDGEHINSIIEIIVKNLRLHLNSRNLLKYSYYAPIVAKLIYYVSTSLSKKQTLGEEYMHLIQVVSRSRRELPSTFIHIIFIILTSFSTIFEKYFAKLTVSYYAEYKKFMAINENEKNFNLNDLLPEWSRVIKEYITPNIERLHLSYFYLIDNKYYSLSKRLTSIKYFSLSPNSSIQIQKILFYTGILNLILSFYSLADGVNRIYLSYQRKVNRHSDTFNNFKFNNNDSSLLQKYLEKSKFICPLCLETAFPSSTPCGHIYCFSCLTTGTLKDNSKYANKNTPLKCPQCRYCFTFSRVIPLINY
uniref:RING-type E3 ubiquitin transferase n=1 Tax=Parastrongyloides trichosuri TaxID=131310 RepID=A0A0N4ZUI4_PARTI